MLGLYACLTVPVLADDLAVRVQHDITVLGADGVTRITRFGERLVRQGNNSWVVRIVPAGAHGEAEHAHGGKAHKHMDLAAAARWVSREADGKLRVRLINSHEKMVVEVPAADYGNIGFDGKWATASNLLDPEQLKRMKPISRSAPQGARWYEGSTASARVQVLWDATARYPMRIESRNASGSSHSTMEVNREPMPRVLPWTQLEGYARKDYSDLLD